MPQGVANTLYNLGNANLDLSEFQRAIDLITESLAIWRATNGVRGEAFTLQSLGQAAARLGDPVKARAHYEQALALWQRVGDRRGEAIVLNHLAGNAMARDAFDEAAAWVEKSLVSSAKAANARREQGDALIVSGQLLRRSGDLAGSEARLREAIEIDDAIKNRIGARQRAHGAGVDAGSGRTLRRGAYRRSRWRWPRARRSAIAAARWPRWRGSRGSIARPARSRRHRHA